MNKSAFYLLKSKLLLIILAFAAIPAEAGTSKHLKSVYYNNNRVGFEICTMTVSGGWNVWDCQTLTGLTYKKEDIALLKSEIDKETRRLVLSNKNVTLSANQKIKLAGNIALTAIGGMILVGGGVISTFTPAPGSVAVYVMMIGVPTAMLWESEGPTATYKRYKNQAFETAVAAQISSNDYLKTVNSLLSSDVDLPEDQVTQDAVVRAISNSLAKIPGYPIVQPH